MDPANVEQLTAAFRLTSYPSWRITQVKCLPNKAQSDSSCFKALSKSAAGFVQSGECLRTIYSLTPAVRGQITTETSKCGRLAAGHRAGSRPCKGGLAKCSDES